MIGRLVEDGCLRHSSGFDPEQFTGHTGVGSGCPERHGNMHPHHQEGANDLEHASTSGQKRVSPWLTAQISGGRCNLRQRT